MDPLAFFGKYGEAFRALPAGADPDAAARGVYDLYRRHAAQVNRAVDRLIAANASAIRGRTLPATSLVRLVSDGGPPAEADPEPPPPAADNLFRRVGQMWEARFRGGRVNHYVPSKGLAYLHAMLASPGKPVSSVGLVAAVGRRPADFALGDDGATADPEALAAYHARLGEIDGELDEAREFNDPGRVAELEREREGLLAEVKRQTGFGNRLKKGANPRERVRKAVYQAVSRAYEVIDKYDTDLARHLRDRVTCGMHPVYAPVDGVAWET